MSLNENQRQSLLALAKMSIGHGLQSGRPIAVNLSDYPAELTELRASFVTLQKHGQLRGCIGMLEASRPLAQDVAENAFSAAFHDPRFPAVTEDELPDLYIHISVLSPAVPMQFTSEADLLAHLKPGVDGLILQEGHRRATFLPSVWETLPEPEQFLRHLKQKAGLPAAYWSGQLNFYRYQAEIIS